jgi:hypothetical protein
MSMNMLVIRRGGKLRKRRIVRVYCLLRSDGTNDESDEREGRVRRKADGGFGLALVQRRFRKRGLLRRRAK